MTESSNRQHWAEVISIGDELTSGQRLDTNSQWISRQLADLGVTTRFHTTVADDVEAMESAFSIACNRAAFVITTGGLGPTDDDLTRSVIASIAHVDLIEDEETVNLIKARFELRGRRMPANNLVQARFPNGSTIIGNQNGTAPGIDIQLPVQEPHCRLFALPGVPSELKAMWFDHVAPAIQDQLPGQRVLMNHAIHCFGLAESDVEEKLPGLIQRGRVPAVGITASKATITLRISAQGDSSEDCLQQIKPTASLIHEQLADFVFGENGTTLEETVIRLLGERNKTLSIVDMGSCGLIADWLQRADPAHLVYQSVASHKPDPRTEDGLPVFDNPVRHDSDYCLWIGPVRDSCPRPFRQMRITGGREVASKNFGVIGNPAIQVEHAIKQGLNFLRLAVIHDQL